MPNRLKSPSAVVGVSLVRGTAVRRLFVGSFLAFLTSGLLLFDRGFFQDDALAFFSALRVSHLPWHLRLHPPGEGPTRLLSLLPYSIAFETGAPLRALQAMLLATWTVTALLAGALATRLRPTSPGIGTCAVILVATASSDFLTGSLVGLGYQISVAAFLAAFVMAIDYTRQGRIWTLLVASGCLVLGLWIIDVAALSFPLIPALLAGSRHRESRRRAFVLGGVWLTVTLPYVLAFSRFMRGDYAGSAVRRAHSWVFAAVAEQVAHNFLPWRWGPYRSAWFESPPAVLSSTVMATLAAVAALLGIWTWWRERYHLDESSSVDTTAPPAPLTIAGLAVLLLIANVPATFLPLSAIHYRTHLLSRIWASLLIALLAVTLRRRQQRPLGMIAFVLVGLFLFYGTWGGLERQSYFASTWIDHRRELTSIVEAAPRVPDDTELVLVVPRHRRYMATEASYLARVWSSLLYADPLRLAKTTLVAAHRGTGCRAESVGLRCWGEGAPPCPELGPCSGRLLPYTQVLVLEFDPTKGIFARAESLPKLIVNDHHAPDAWRSSVTMSPAQGPALRDRLLVRPGSSPWSRLFDLEGQAIRRARAADAP